LNGSSPEGGMMVRLLDLGRISHLHSQSVYHAVAYCATDRSPGTIILLAPKEPYVSIGFHQVLEKDIDLEYCRESGLPIIRREVGGGSVYLDSDQLFFQCVFPWENAPKRVDFLYKKFLQPAVNAYRTLGIDAQHLPGHDIQVQERKICGTGAGRIGEASVVVGNIMFDFNYGEMSRILKVGSESLRDMIHDSMGIYVSSLKRELGAAPDRDEVKKVLVGEFGRVLGEPLQEGDLTPDEHRMVDRIDSRFRDPKWLFQKGGKISSFTKITADVRVTETLCVSPGGTLNILIRLKKDVIDGIRISGRLLSFPADFSGLEKRLVGISLEGEHLPGILESFFREKDLFSAGLGPQDLLRALLANHN